MADPDERLRAIFDQVLPKDRRPKRLETRARHARDRIIDVLESDALEPSDRVALEDARAALERYTRDET